ncbi:hypothetical protein Csa_022660 [Cucumis sativus]|nr:hypothetical protein Csa_022660 [Cucumis sativus]
MGCGCKNCLDLPYQGHQDNTLFEKGTNIEFEVSRRNFNGSGPLGGKNWDETLESLLIQSVAGLTFLAIGRRRRDRIDFSGGFGILVSAILEDLGVVASPIQTLE